MSDTMKPHFASWERSTLDKLANDLWDDNIKHRDANEQLRMDNRDLSQLLREANARIAALMDDGK
jgi:hypothetical protein